MKATDQDAGRNAEVEYSILSTTSNSGTANTEDALIFRIDPRTGVVTTRTPLDREKTEVYTVILSVSDQATPPSARKTANATLVVRVLDDNDNYPQFTERTYSAWIPEDLDYTANPVIARIRATDADSGNNAAVRYAIIGGNTQNTFSIDSMVGDVALVKPLDYESTRSYKIVIRAQDGGSPARSNTTQLLVHVGDVNDNAPRFYTSHFQESVSENVPVGYSILRIQAYDADEGANAQIKYTIGARDFTGASTENFPITVNAETGWLYTTKQLDREQCSRCDISIISNFDFQNPCKNICYTVIIFILFISRFKFRMIICSI